MDPNTQATQQPAQQVSQQPAQQPQEAMVQKPKKNILGKIISIFFVIVLLLIVAVGAYYLGTQQFLAKQGIAVPGLSMLPQQKTTSQAKQQSNKTVEKAPTLTPTPTPDPTANWQIYSNAKYMFSIKYPTGFTKNESTTNYFYVEFKPTGSNALVPSYVVSVIPDTFVAKDVAAYNYMSSDWINNIDNLSVGETKTMDSAASFVRLADITVASKSATAIEVTATGYKQHRVYVKNNGNIYMISNYYQSADELNNFDLLLSTFNFTQ